MNRGDGMLEHIALDTYDRDSDTNTTEYRQYAVHEDWQNTVWALSDTAGDLVEEYRQGNPFGSSESFDASSTSLGDFASKVYHYKRMHGGVVEEVSRLYDFRNRWYSPKAGAWLSRDPLWQVDSENLMQAMRGNPMSFADILGLACGLGSNTIGYIGGAEICFNGNADSDSFDEGCDEGSAGCTTAAYGHHPPGDPTTVITISIDPNNLNSIEVGIALFFHELEHAKSMAACHENCVGQAGGDPQGFVDCMSCCEWINNDIFGEEEEGRACRAQQGVYDWLVSFRKGGEVEMGGIENAD